MDRAFRGSPPAVHFLLSLFRPLPYLLLLVIQCCIFLYNAAAPRSVILHFGLVILQRLFLSPLKPIEVFERTFWTMKLSWTFLDRPYKSDSLEQQNKRMLQAFCVPVSPGNSLSLHGLHLCCQSKHPACGRCSGEWKYLAQSAPDGRDVYRVGLKQNRTTATKMNALWGEGKKNISYNLI